ELGVEPPERLLDPAVAAARASALKALLQPRLSIDADGGPLTIAWTDLTVLPDKQSVRLGFRGQTRVRLGSDWGQTRVRPSIVRLKVGLFPYDPQHQTFVNVYEDSALRQQAILDANHAEFEYFSGAPRGTAAVVTRFIAAGIHHILIGPDHLLFLVGLLLLGG